MGSIFLILHTLSQIYISESPLQCLFTFEPLPTRVSISLSLSLWSIFMSLSLDSLYLSISPKTLYIWGSPWIYISESPSQISLSLSLSPKCLWLSLSPPESLNVCPSPESIFLCLHSWFSVSESLPKSLYHWVYPPNLYIWLFTPTSYYNESIPPSCYVWSPPRVYFCLFPFWGSLYLWASIFESLDPSLFSLNISVSHHLSLFVSESPYPGVSHPQVSISLSHPASLYLWAYPLP